MMTDYAALRTERSGFVDRIHEINQRRLEIRNEYGTLLGGLSTFTPREIWLENDRLSDELRMLRALIVIATEKMRTLRIRKETGTGAQHDQRRDRSTRQYRQAARRA